MNANDIKIIIYLTITCPLVSVTDWYILSSVIVHASFSNSPSFRYKFFGTKPPSGILT